MSKPTYLYEEYETLRKYGNTKDVPNFIESSLADHIVLRPYQREAIENFITFYESPETDKDNIHHLFQMATGSGKTVIMAALIVYLYSKGYNKVLFFVNQNNIVAKTKENFTNPTSNKYLFNDLIQIDGNIVPINTVDNFSSTNKDAINICFTSIQNLHGFINYPSENNPTIKDFENNNVLLISDESHHLNVDTKRGNEKKEQENKSWEETINRIQQINKNNILLDFTATAGLNNENIEQKYNNKLIYNYDLAEFRESGYTKEFDNFQTDYSQWYRTLIALIISEYRKFLFAENKINAKPVVLLKSASVPDSEEFYSVIFDKIYNLNESELSTLESTESLLLKKALDYFKEKGSGSYSLLIESLKSSFNKETSIIMNNERQKENKLNQLKVNSLEERSNPYRLIFTVNMLNEGWDVLNLYDIVRLYETRNSATSKATISEAQLIGRGARYYPFKLEEGQNKYKRKYDNDLKNENRILETMLFHSKYDSKYIYELRTALKATGLLPDSSVEREYVLKDTFKDSDFFKYGKVFINERLDSSEIKRDRMDDNIRHKIYYYNLSSGITSMYTIFDDKKSNQMNDTEEIDLDVKEINLDLKEIPLNILYAALDSYDVFSFNKLKLYFKNLKTKKEFLLSDDYLGEVRIVIRGRDIFNISNKDLFLAVKNIFRDIANDFDSLKDRYVGSTDFKEKSIRDVLIDKKVKFTTETESGAGVPQSDSTSENQQLDLANEDWYVYNDNFGSDQEKSFVKYFSTLYDDFKNKYDEVYLVRNERVAELALYSFEDGSRFEPDFILFLHEKETGDYVQEQLFIEPKGAKLIADDKWKEDFLKQIEHLGKTVKIHKDSNEYRIYGLSFYNETVNFREFEKDLSRFLEK